MYPLIIWENEFAIKEIFLFFMSKQPVYEVP